jgi:hypothetical protein
MSLEGPQYPLSYGMPVTTDDRRFVIGGCFFPFLFTQLLRKMHDCSFCFLYFNFNHCFLSFYFCFYPFYKIFIYFQFSFSIIIIYVIFFISVLIRLIFNFFRLLFC